MLFFDANPATNGYVLLNVGFETLTNSTFLAEAQTACAILGFTENKLLKNLEIYPIPTSTSVRINSDSTILATEIVDINGWLIQSLSQNTKYLLLKIENLNSGVYFLKLLTENGNRIEKIVKK